MCGKLSFRKDMEVACLCVALPVPLALAWLAS